MLFYVILCQKKGKLNKNSVVAFFATTATDDKTFAKYF